MAYDYNVISVQGRLGRDPEFGSIKNGSRFIRFTLANSPGKDNETTWYNVIGWDSLCDSLKNAKKGSSLIVTGIHSLRPYKNKDGQERQSNDIKMLSFVYLSTGKNSNANGGNNTAKNSAEYASTGQSYDDEIPY